MVFIMEGGGHIWLGNDAIRGGVASKHLGDLSWNPRVISSEKLHQHHFAKGSIDQVLDYYNEQQTRRP